MKIYKVVQKISTHDLHLKPAMPLGWFAQQQTTSSRCHGNIPAFLSFLPYSKLQAMVTTVTLAEDFMQCNHNNPMKQSQTIAVQG
jgi:hypothetical protein